MSAGSRKKNCTYNRNAFDIGPEYATKEADVLRAKVIIDYVDCTTSSLGYSVSGPGGMSWWFIKDICWHWEFGELGALPDSDCYGSLRTAQSGPPL